MKKSVKACALGVAVLAAGVFASCSGGSSENRFDNVDLIPVTLKKDGNWSMVNAKGEIVYDGEFKNEPSLCYNGVFSVEEGEGYTLYKQGAKGPEVLGEAEKLKSVGYMNDGLVPVVFPNKRISVLDKDGKQKFELAPINGFEVVSCEDGYEDGLLAIKMEDGKYGYLDKDGKNVIKPTYKYAYNFADGLAVVAQEVGDSTETKTEYVVINKKGETVFKIKEGYELDSRQFEYGYLSAKNDDRCVLIDKKGEVIKFPAKINDIRMYNEKYVIFSNEDRMFGVADMKGEILIRPKYETIMFDEGNNFLACKDSKDKEILRLNKDGEEVAKFDFENMYYLGKFGYLAKDGNTTSLVDKEGKAICKDDFYDFGMRIQASRGDIESDYFNREAIAATLVGMVTDKGVGDVTIGEPASQLLKGSEPSKYSYSYSADLPDLKKEGFRYTIAMDARFAESIANYDYDYNTYSGSYKWNPDAKVANVSINLYTEKDWGKEGFDELIKAFKAKGWKEYKVGEIYSSNGALLLKGKLCAYIQVADESKNSYVVISSPEQKDIDAVASQITNATVESAEAKKNAANATAADEEAYYEEDGFRD